MLENRSDGPSGRLAGLAEGSSDDGDSETIGFIEALGQIHEFLASGRKWTREATMLLLELQAVQNWPADVCQHFVRLSITFPFLIYCEESAFHVDVVAGLFVKAGFTTGSILRELIDTDIVIGIVFFVEQVGAMTACLTENVALAIALLAEMDFRRFGEILFDIMPAAIALPAVAISEIFAVIGRSSDEWDIQDRESVAQDFLIHGFPGYLRDSGSMASLLIFVTRFRCAIPLIDRLGLVVERLAAFPNRLTTARFVLAIFSVDAHLMCTAALDLEILDFDDFTQGPLEYQEIVLTIAEAGISMFFHSVEMPCVIAILQQAVENGPMFLRFRAAKIVMHIGADRLFQSNDWSFETAIAMSRSVWNILRNGGDDEQRQMALSFCGEVENILASRNICTLVVEMESVD
jgi:hypothetical protein